MALKDWKKKNGNYWNKSKLLSIMIRDYHSFVSVEIWHDLGWTSAGREYAHDFKTKESALNFTRKYMRTH